MRGKLIFVVGLAAGYVLGTRAGRARYDQIKSAAESVWNFPPVQGAANAVQDFAGERVDTLGKKVQNAARNGLASLISTKPADKPAPKAAAPKSAAPKSAAPKTATPKPAEEAASQVPSAAKAAAAAAKKPAAKKTTDTKAPRATKASDS